MSLPQPSPVAMEPADSSKGESSRGEFSPPERTLLLRLAHESIVSALEHREISLNPPSDHLSQPRGVFTSLYLRGELRGCVGYVLPISPVYRAVADTARAAAFEDTRFQPVRPPSRNRTQYPVATATHLRRRHRDRPSRPPHHHSWASRLAPAASAHRTKLGPHNFPRTNLSQSRPAPGCLAKRRNPRSFHCGSLRRKTRAGLSLRKGK